MSSLTVFQFNSIQVRVVVVNNEPWFVAKDLCQVLGISKYRDAISRLDDDERESFKLDTLGGKQDMITVSESGMYALVISSRKSEAKTFRKWITSEVLPSIRKTGEYKVKDKILNKSEEWLKERQESKEVRRELTDSIKDYIDRHPELSPNAIKFMYSNATETLNLGLFAKRTKRLKEVIGITPSNSIRDYLDSKEIICLKAVEYLACQFIDMKDMNPCEAIKQAIELSLTTKRFASKYNSLLPQLTSIK